LYIELEMGKNDLRDKLGRRIVQLRDSLGLRQVDLANRADIDDGFLRRIETGKVNPTIKTLEKIANGLEVEMKDLFDFR
jgi:transcriptional regulator with XRE-family HTH domain